MFWPPYSWEQHVSSPGHPPSLTWYPGWWWWWLAPPRRPVCKKTFQTATACTTNECQSPLNSKPWCNLWEPLPIVEAPWKATESGHQDPETHHFERILHMAATPRRHPIWTCFDLVDCSAGSQQQHVVLPAGTQTPDHDGQAHLHPDGQSFASWQWWQRSTLPLGSPRWPWVPYPSPGSACALILKWFLWASGVRENPELLFHRGGKG